MSYSGPGTGPANKVPRGNAAKVLLPIVGVPIAAAMLYNWYSAGNALKTPGVTNIEKAYSAGGATGTHTMAYGGTPRGNSKASSPSDNPNSQTGGMASMGKTNKDGEYSHGAEHRPMQPLGPGKTWNDAMYGNKDGKSDNK